MADSSGYPRLFGEAPVLRGVSVLFAALFGWAAALQWNDPDPVVWIALYLGAATVCVLSAMRRLSWTFGAAVTAIALGWAAVLATRTVGVVDFRRIFDSFEMKGDLRVEEAREMVGLLIVAGVCGALTLLQRRPRARR